MFDLSQSQLKRLTAVHGWSAVILGLLLYAVIATGAVAVFAHEIGRWSAGGVRVAEPLDEPLDAKVRQLAETVPPDLREDVGVWAGEGDSVNIFFHKHMLHPESGFEEDFGTLLRVDSAGEVLAREEGFIWRDPAAYEESALRQFLVDLHVQLYLPSPWGLILTGILGLMMMAAVISGVFMHRHIIRDLFVAERPGRRLVSSRDRHILAGTWGLPFAFVLAFTGSFFSFAGSVGFPLVAAVAFGGDEIAMSETLFEAPVPEDATPAPLASLDYIVADSRERNPGPVTFVDVAHYGRADARVTVWHDPADGAMFYGANTYDGTTRAFLGTQQPVGTTPSVGGVLYGLMYPLHFGHFAGLLSKAIWGALGISMCFVILSGFKLWVQRRSDDPQWRRFGRAVVITGYGLPLAMIASGYAFFLSRPALDAFWWTPVGFVIGAALAIALGLRISDAETLGRVYRRVLGTGCMLLPILRVGFGGMDWAAALLSEQYDVISVDILLVAAGIALWGIPGVGTARRPALEPAE